MYDSMHRFPFLEKQLRHKYYRAIMGRSCFLLFCGRLHSYVLCLMPNKFMLCYVMLCYVMLCYVMLCIWHLGLLFKLHQNGITVKLLNWISSYLFEIKQRVFIGSSMSSPKVIKAGVPQGTVLGPLFS